VSEKKQIRGIYRKKDGEIMSKRARNTSKSVFFARVWLVIGVAAGLFVLSSDRVSLGESARTEVRVGNELYGRQQYNKAIDKYDSALVEMPEALVPKFNKANSYYRLDDLDKAVELYKEVGAESKDMGLVAKAKYNLGNCYFKQGVKQKDSDLEKAVEDLKTSISCWRQVLDIQPKNEKAAKNIEVARLTIKDIIDQLNKQKEKQQQDNKQNKQQQNKQQQKQEQSKSADKKSNQQKGQGKKAAGEPNEPPKPKQSQKQQQKAGQKEQQKQQAVQAPRTTADEILDRERRQRKQRQLMQRARYEAVDKDW